MLFLIYNLLAYITMVFNPHLPLDKRLENRTPFDDPADTKPVSRKRKKAGEELCYQHVLKQLKQLEKIKVQMTEESWRHKNDISLIVGVMSKKIKIKEAEMENLNRIIHILEVEKSNLGMEVKYWHDQTVELHAFYEKSNLDKQVKYWRDQAMEFHTKLEKALVKMSEERIDVNLEDVESCCSCGDKENENKPIITGVCQYCPKGIA